MAEERINDKLDKLRSLVKAEAPLAVAFSGGVDSSLLLRVANETVPGRVIALFAASVLQKKRVARRVRGTAESLGCRLEVVDVDPLSWPEFRQNRAERCYLCKKRIYQAFLDRLPAGYRLADGTNVDDLQADRPGFRAIRELGVLTPLLDAGFTKRDIRAAGREMGLACWDLPSESCLATRIPQGTVITPELLDLVEMAESFLADLGFAGCRVRFEQLGVVVSLVGDDMERFVGKEVRGQVSSFFLKHGFYKVFLDLSDRAGIVF